MNKKKRKFPIKDTFKIFTVCLTLSSIFFAIIRLYESSSTIIFLGIIFLCILLSVIGAFFIQRRISAKSLINIEKSGIYELGNEITSLISDIEKPSEILKLRIIRGRYDIELRKFKNIISGGWTLRALDKNSYFVYIFRQVVSNLKRGDKYLAVSSIDFWEKDKEDKEWEKNKKTESLHPTERISFLNTCNSAIDRGVIIKRYFLVDRKEIDKPASSYNDRLKKIISRLMKYKSLSENYRAYNHKNMAIFHDSDNCFYFYLSDNYLQDIKEGHIFSLVSNKSSNSFLSVVSDLNGDIPTVDLKFFNNETNDYYSKLKGIYRKYKDAEPSMLKNVNEMAELLGILDH